MIQELVLNATILVAVISIKNQIFRNTELNSQSPFKLKLLDGVLAGFFGISLMLYTIHITPTFIVDFRNFAIILPALYGGAVPAALSCLMIAFFRILYFGINAYSVVALVIIIATGAGCILLSKAKLPINKKWITLVLYCLIVSTPAFYLSIKDPYLLLRILTVYYIGTGIVAIGLYSYVEYLEGSNRIYRNLKEESAKDFLTGLNNVRQFDRLFNYISGNALKKDEKLSLLYIDIDNFKKINDTYGHPEGDVVLKELGNILIQNCRSFDIVSRNGGEEFSVLLPNCPAGQAYGISERIRTAVESHKFILSCGGKIHITISIGVASYPDTTKEMDKLIEQADTALYNAKRTGKNKSVLAA